MECEWGKFSDFPKMWLLENGRDMMLATDFSYTDRAGKVWSVPCGAKVNGANIPQALWTLVGGPWDGLHRYASILHDWYCAKRTEPWLNVQLMFYEACRCAGMGEFKANLLYFAVKMCAKWE